MGKPVKIKIQQITYNGEKDEMYFDAYKNWENILISREQFNYIVDLQEE